jgi:hypothetical protein
MTYSDKFGQFFGRKIDRSMGGYVAVLHLDGAPATRLDANVYPVGSWLSARYEHPEGILLHAHDAAALGLSIEEI